MAQLQQIGVKLSQGQNQTLAKAYRNNEGVTIRLAKHALSGSDVLMVPSKTGRKLAKNRNADKGMQITIPKSNIRKQSGSGIFSAVLPALRAVAPTIGKTLGLSALAGAASEVVQFLNSPFLPTPWGEKESSGTGLLVKVLVK